MEGTSCCPLEREGFDKRQSPSILLVANTFFNIDQPIFNRLEGYSLCIKFIFKPFQAYGLRAKAFLQHFD